MRETLIDKLNTYFPPGKSWKKKINMAKMRRTVRLGKSNTSVQLPPYYALLFLEARDGTQGLGHGRNVL